jgi:hypothetical protein
MPEWGEEPWMLAVAERYLGSGRTNLLRRRLILAGYFKRKAYRLFSWALSPATWIE